MVWVLVLVLHGLIIIGWLHQRAQRVQPPPVVITLNLLPDETPPPPPPDDTPKKQLPRQPAASRLDSPTPPAKTFVSPVPTATHRPDEQEWVTPAQQGDTGPMVHRAPPEYAYEVKSRIISKVIHPKTPYPTPPGFDGDPRLLIRQCTIPYELVVDRQGRLVSYEIDSCHDEVLDPAAEAAILKAQPYPLPPGGAEQYRIYGSINFKRPDLSR